jgi:hypothetical protein
MAAQLRAVESRPLLAGLPDRGAALQRQKANLVQFAADPAHAKAFAAMPYEPWTSAPAQPKGANGFQFEVRASTHVRGLRGVFPCKPVPASSQELRLLDYHGLLVTHELYEAFYNKYYCPTGLELPSLQFKGVDGVSVGVIMLGDPTAMAVIVNDGRYGCADGQAQRCRKASASERACSSFRSLILSAVMLCGRVLCRLCHQLQAQVVSQEPAVARAD